MKPSALQVYQVGGAVRDRLLGHSATDNDWVVVGSSAEDMLARGFKPVGRDFPVFLHPRTHEEYALARTERKTAAGYHGFSFYTAPDVTLEQDLSRRDLTINAIAMDQHGHIIDPFQGQRDLALGMLRHVSPAFAEDPVRILRTARFAARFGFDIAPETQQLMQAMVTAGEVDALVAERVWQEMARALQTTRPSLFFTTLRACGALARILPEIDALFSQGTHGQHARVDAGMQRLQAIDLAATERQPLAIVFALLAGLPQTGRDDAAQAAPEAALLALCQRLRIPNDCRDLARLALRGRARIDEVASLNAQAILALFRDCDALRRPERFQQLLTVARLSAQAASSAADTHHPQSDWLTRLLTAASQIDAAAIAQRTQDRHTLPRYLDEARLELISATRQQLGLETKSGGA